ncbi:hypothetical protein ABZ912_27610 [Nonomuraea angiospora]|uniref:hypothetical protein n=1 Tax=Nonomuraea angiospora TaxID=46172 RepID=UPI0033EE2C6C
MTVGDDLNPDIDSITRRGEPLGSYGTLLAAIATAAWPDTRGVVDRVLSAEGVRFFLSPVPVRDDVPAEHR